MGWNDRKEFGVLLGKTLVEINANDDEILFRCSDGSEYRMFHYQDCCESVTVESVVGDWGDLIGTPLTMAEEVVGETAQPVGWTAGEYQDSVTWTFYKLATVKGYVDIRWCGESNGYYSESVDFEEIKPSTGTAQ